MTTTNSLSDARRDTRQVFDFSRLLLIHSQANSRTTNYSEHCVACLPVRSLNYSRAGLQGFNLQKRLLSPKQLTINCLWCHFGLLCQQRLDDGPKKDRSSTLIGILACQRTFDNIISAGEAQRTPPPPAHCMIRALTPP